MRIEKQADVEMAYPGRHNVTGHPGLILIVSKNETHRRWAFRYVKPATDRATETGLGDANLVELETACDEAHKFRKLVANGIDPVEQKREERRKKISFGKVVEDFLAFKKPSWRSAKYAGYMEKLLTNHCGSLATKNIRSITSDEVAAVLRPLYAQSTSHGKLVRAIISQVFDYAIGNDHCEINPAERRRLQHRLPNRRTIVNHFTAMDYTEMPSFVRQLHIEQQRDDVQSPFAIEFLILTACRSNEVVGMRWDEVPSLWTIPPDLTWNIPAVRMRKSDRPHRVPLSPRAVELLERQRKRTKGDFVWPSPRGRKPMSGKALYIYLVKNMGVKATIHGFRSSFRDWAGNETNFDRVTCELALAHKAGDATELAYRRGDALAKRRALMTAWADYCRSLCYDR